MKAATVGTGRHSEGAHVRLDSALTTLESVSQEVTMVFQAHYCRKLLYAVVVMYD